MKDPAEYGALILSVNRGLWGEVSSHLRSVQVSYSGAEIKLYFYFDKEIIDDDVESMRVVASSVAADFPESKVIERFFVRDPRCKLKTVRGQHLVYLRKESLSEN